MKQIIEPIDLGNEIESLPHLDKYNKKVPLGYYYSGIDKIDSAFIGNNIHEFGIDFNIISLEKGLVLVFGDLWKGDKFYINREQVTKTDFTNSVDMKIISVNKFLQAMKTGAFGQGFVGSLASMGIGAILEKAKRNKMENVKGNRIILQYIDEIGLQQEIIIEVESQFSLEAYKWFRRNWSKEFPIKQAHNHESSMCYIAGVCYQNIFSDELYTFRAYRDNYLADRFWGKFLTKLYYRFAPKLALFLSNKNATNKVVKKIILAPMYRHLKSKGF